MICCEQNLWWHERGLLWYTWSLREAQSLIVIQSLEEFWLGCMLIQLVLTISAWIFPFLQNTAIFQIKHKVWDNKQTHKLVVQIQLHVEQSFENTYTATEMQWVKCCRSCIELKIEQHHFFSNSWSGNFRSSKTNITLTHIMIWVV